MGNILIFLFSLFSSHTMSPNASLHTLTTSNNGQTATVDIDAIMDNVSIVLYTLTVVLGITGNSMVIWVAGFKLKVDGQTSFNRSENESLYYIIWSYGGGGGELCLSRWSKIFCRCSTGLRSCDCKGQRILFT